MDGKVHPHRLVPLQHALLQAPHHRRRQREEPPRRDDRRHLREPSHPGGRCRPGGEEARLHPRPRPRRRRQDRGGQHARDGVRGQPDADRGPLEEDRDDLGDQVEPPRCGRLDDWPRDVAALYQQGRWDHLRGGFHQQAPPHRVDGGTDAALLRRPGLRGRAAGRRAAADSCEQAGLPDRHQGQQDRKQARGEGAEHAEAGASGLRKVGAEHQPGTHVADGADRANAVGKRCG
mmetsp:Transcript_8748/g.21801  ORF Transcript_8748/g.21801 Transcript_8748/m.21801 type:complete len:233 (-) Transcript_8748:49-747(-)